MKKFLGSLILSGKKKGAVQTLQLLQAVYGDDAKIADIITELLLKKNPPPPRMIRANGRYYQVLT